MAGQGQAQARVAPDGQPLLAQKQKPNKLQELWFGTLPMKIRQLPHGVLVVGLVLQILLLVTFVLLAGYEYQDNVGTQYMSVTQDNDKCIKYSRKWSGTYQLGTDGLWSSDTDFDATKALYEVKFSDYEYPVPTWIDTHAPSIYDKVVSLNNTLKTQPIASSILYLLTKTWSLADDSMSLTLLSEPHAMLGRTAVAAKLLYNSRSGYTSYANNCSVNGGPTPSSTAFATATSVSDSSQVTMTFDTTDLSSTGYTNVFIQSSNLGSSSSTSTITFDLRSAIVAAAVNGGVLDLSDLEKVSTLSSSKGLYYLLKFEGMTPITCTTKAATPVCNVVVGSSEGGMLPLLMHRNNYEKMVNSTSALPRCTCQTSASSCQKWDLMLALIHNDGCFVTSKQSTPEAYYTGGYNMLVVNLYSLSTYMNGYYMSLPKIHCKGPLTLENDLDTGHGSDSTNYRSTAPETLTESYYVCGYTNYAIWSNTISTAWANTDLVKEVLIVVLLIVAVQVIRNTYKTEVKFKREQVDVAEVQALRARLRRLERSLNPEGGGADGDENDTGEGVAKLEEGISLFKSAIS